MIEVLNTYSYPTDGLVWLSNIACKVLWIYCTFCTISICQVTACFSFFTRGVQKFLQLQKSSNDITHTVIFLNILQYQRVFFYFSFKLFMS